MKRNTESGWHLTMERIRQKHTGWRSFSNARQQCSHQHGFKVRTPQWMHVRQPTRVTVWQFIGIHNSFSNRNIWNICDINQMKQTTCIRAVIAYTLAWSAIRWHFTALSVRLIWKAQTAVILSELITQYINTSKYSLFDFKCNITFKVCNYVISNILTWH